MLHLSSVPFAPSPESVLKLSAAIAFDVFGQLLSPAAGFVELAPMGLAKLVIAKLFDVSTTGGAYVLHILTGLLFYPNAQHCGAYAAFLGGGNHHSTLSARFTYTT